MENDELLAAIRDLKRTVVACSLAQTYYEAMRLNPAEDEAKGLPREAIDHLHLIRLFEKNLETQIS
jgi:hypothetical protein